MKNSRREPGKDAVARPFYTDVELADRYRVHRTTIWNWEKRGIVKKKKIGGVTRFSEVPEADPQ